MNIKNIFKKKKVEEGNISLTFKMPLINFINYFSSNHNWNINFDDKELQEVAKAIKEARKGKSQELIFEDKFNLEKELKKRGLLNGKNNNI